MKIYNVRTHYLFALFSLSLCLHLLLLSLLLYFPCHARTYRSADTRWKDINASDWIVDRINACDHRCLISIQCTETTTPKGFGTPTRYCKVSRLHIYTESFACVWVCACVRVCTALRLVRYNEYIAQTKINNKTEYKHRIQANWRMERCGATYIVRMLSAYTHAYVYTCVCMCVFTFATVQCREMKSTQFFSYFSVRNTKSSSHLLARKMCVYILFMLNRLWLDCLSVCL